MGSTTEKLPKDRGDGVPAMPGSRGAGRRGIHLEDNRGGEEIQGVAAGAGAMPVVQEGVCKGVTGNSL